MDNSISDMFSVSDIFDNSNVTINNNFEQLRIIFEDVLCTVSFVDVEENVFKDEIPKLKLACIEAMDQIHEHIKNIQSNNELLEEIKQLIKRYIGLLNLAHTAIKYISNKVSFAQVQSLPLAVSEILLQTFKHCKESDTVYGNHFASVSFLLTDLFKKANELQSSFLALLNNILIFDLHEENQVIFMLRVSEILASIGEIVSGLDIKTTAVIWKSYLVLLQKHNEYIKCRINLEPPLKFLCTEIVNSLDAVGNMSDMKSVEKSLKISSFNLKIVIKLCSLADSFGDAIKNLFNLLVTLKRYSIPYLQYQKRNSVFIDLMQIYVTVASEPLLNCLFNNREFVQHYFTNINGLFKNDDKRLSAIFLTISIMKKIINSGNDQEIKILWVSDDEAFNIIIIFFLSLNQFHAEFCLDYPIQIQGSIGEPTRITSLYEYILVHLISLILIVNLKQFKIIQKLIFSSILDINIWKSMISSDIWIALGRYGTAEFCFESFKFLINIYLKLQEYNRIEIKNLSSLIRRNYCILSDKYRTEIFNNYPYNKFIKLWIIIGIKNEPLLINKLPNLINEATEKIDSFFGTKSVESFQNMYELLELVSTHIPEESNEIQLNNLANRVVKLWSLNIDNQINDQPWMLKFIYVRSKITSELIQQFDNEELLKILQSMNELKNDNSKLYKCLILKSLASKQIDSTQNQPHLFSLISTHFYTLITDKNPIIKQRALETFVSFAFHTSHEEILANIARGDSNLEEEISNYLLNAVQEPQESRTDYFRAQNEVSFQHKCRESLKLSEPMQKKKKLDSDVNVSAMIRTMKYNCDSLVEFYKNEQISYDVLVELNNITSKLQTLLNK